MMPKKVKYRLTQSEIICYAINGLAPHVAKMDAMIKGCNDPKLAEELKDNEFFFKFKKLLELYELENGTEYGVEFDYDFLK